MSGSSRRARRGMGTLPRLACAVLLVVAAVSPQAAAPVFAAAWGPCLDCHAEEGFSVDTTSGKPFNLTVSAAQLSGSVHRGLECDACHRGINLDQHPEGNAIASAEAYRRGASRACLGCHPVARLRAKAHASFAADDQNLACVECHGAHGVRTVAALKESAPLNEYCLTCHARALTLPGGGTAHEVDAAQLKGSVHPDHGCADCHEGFSKSAHPASVGGDRHHRSLAAARTCARCHEEKLRQAEGSIHFTLLRSGMDGAPTCTDCHSAHAVAPKERFATLSGSPCRVCHEQIFAAYAASMHGKARGTEGHLDAPLCSDCHRAHDVRGSASPELVRAACVGCHPAVADLHAAWLPNTALHLDVVSCVACHSPEAQRVVALRLVEKGSERLLTEREVGELLGGEAGSMLDPEGDGIDGLELWTALRQLESKRLASAAKLDVVGRLEVARGVDAHRLVSKAGAIRTCENCHQSGASAFGRVAVSLARDDGRPKRFAGSPEVLTEAASIVSVNGFYALGSTRYQLLDWLLPLAVAGGLAVVALHLTFRIRAARAHKKG